MISSSLQIRWNLLVNIFSSWLLRDRKQESFSRFTDCVTTDNLVCLSESKLLWGQFSVCKLWHWFTAACKICCSPSFFRSLIPPPPLPPHISFRSCDIRPLKTMFLEIYWTRACRASVGSGERCYRIQKPVKYTGGKNFYNEGKLTPRPNLVQRVKQKS